MIVKIRGIMLDSQLISSLMWISYLFLSVLFFKQSHWFHVGLVHQVSNVCPPFPRLCFWIVPHDDGSGWFVRTWSKTGKQSWKMIWFRVSAGRSLSWAFSMKSLISVLGLSEGCSGIPEKMRLSCGLFLWMSTDPFMVLFDCSVVVGEFKAS